MKDEDRFKLHFGPYRAPRVRYGKTVADAVRGEVVVVGLSDGRIPWPIGKKGRAKSLLICGGLERAIRLESSLAVQHWWGIGFAAVWRWRKALGVGPTPPGTSRLRSEYTKEEYSHAARRKAWSKARDPERRAKIAAARRGKPRPDHVRAILNRNGKTTSEAARAKMSAAHKARGTRPPWLNAAWTAAEDELVRTLTTAEVSERTGRTIGAVRCRRQKLGLPDGRRRGVRNR